MTSRLNNYPVEERKFLEDYTRDHIVIQPTSRIPTKTGISTSRNMNINIVNKLRAQ